MDLLDPNHLNSIAFLSPIAPLESFLATSKVSSLVWTLTLMEPLTLPSSLAKALLKSKLIDLNFIPEQLQNDGLAVRFQNSRAFVVVVLFLMSQAPLIKITYVNILVQYLLLNLCFTGGEISTVVCQVHHVVRMQLSMP